MSSGLLRYKKGEEEENDKDYLLLSCLFLSGSLLPGLRNRLQNKIEKNRGLFFISIICDLFRVWLLFRNKKLSRGLNNNLMSSLPPFCIYFCIKTKQMVRGTCHQMPPTIRAQPLTLSNNSSSSSSNNNTTTTINSSSSSNNWQAISDHRSVHRLIIQLALQRSIAAAVVAVGRPLTRSHPRTNHLPTSVAVSASTTNPPIKLERDNNYPQFIRGIMAALLRLLHHHLFIIRISS